MRRQQQQQQLKKWLSLDRGITPDAYINRFKQCYAMVILLCIPQQLDGYIYINI